MVTRKDVAQLAGVSTATVSRVMSKSGYVSEAAKEKVERAIRHLNYIPNNLAKNLTQNKSNVVAVLVEDVTNPYYLQILESKSYTNEYSDEIIKMLLDAGAR